MKQYPLLQSKLSSLVAFCRGNRGFAILLLIVISGITFGRILTHEFLIDWDDQLYVVDNPVIRGFSTNNLKAAFSTYFVGNYAPMQIMSYMLDYTLWGMNPSGFLFQNLALHTLCGISFYLLLLKHGIRNSIAFTAAILFLVHPVQVETVAWISQRKNLLAMFFFLTAFHWYLRFKKGSDHRNLSYIGVFVFFILAMLAKSVAVILPLVLILHDLCIGGEKDWRRIILDKLPLLAAAAGCAFVAILSQGVEYAGGIRQAGYHGGSPWTTFLTMLPVFMAYMRIVIFPVGLSAVYDPAIKTGVDASVIAAVIVMAISIYGLFLLWHRRRDLFFFGCLLWVGLLPVAQIVPLITLMNDRYLYFPMLGIAPLVAEGGAKICCSINLSLRKIVTGIQILLLITLMVLSWQRSNVWNDSMTLWQDTYNKTPNNETVCFSIGVAYQRKGLLTEALHYYEQAISLGPASRDLLHNISMLYLSNNNLAVGWKYVRELVARFPQYDEGYTLLGDYYLKNGDLESAEQAYRRGLELNPQQGNALAMVGMINLRLQRLDIAREFLLRAESVGFDSAELRYSMAALAVKTGDSREALLQLERAFLLGFNRRQALAADPDFVPLHSNPGFRHFLQ
jgi:Flp pilus assembly protein TadD